MTISVIPLHPTGLNTISLNYRGRKYNISFRKNSQLLEPHSVVTKQASESEESPTHTAARSVHSKMAEPKTKYDRQLR